MNKRLLVLCTTVAAIAIFVIAAIIYQHRTQTDVPLARPISKEEESSLIRAHSPVLGKVDAPVTMVEFLDPACEACRAYFPHVKQILKDHPQDIRLVIRYAAFHKGSDEAVKILETARRQGLYEPVIEALFEQQPEWASHGSPNLERAWEIAASKGLDVDRAKQDALNPAVVEVLSQDTEDLRTHNIRQTPTFYVNGRQLMAGGPDQLRRLAENEVLKTKGIAPAEESAVRRVEAKQLCMADNTYLGKEGVAVVIDGKTYYGCGPGSVKHIQENASVRTAIDPVSHTNVDKATAVIGLADDGRIFYFENEENLKKFKP